MARVSCGWPDKRGLLNMRLFIMGIASASAVIGHDEGDGEGDGTWRLKGRAAAGGHCLGQDRVGGEGGRGSYHDSPLLVSDLGTTVISTSMWHPCCGDGVLLRDGVMGDIVV